MPEWLIERGIGETRWALVEGGEIIEARVQLDGKTVAGTRVSARLTNIGAAGRNALAKDADGTEYLLPLGAPGVSHGAPVEIEVTRETIPGRELWKRPMAKLADETPSKSVAVTGRSLTLPAARDELAEAGWNDLLEEARSGSSQFGGGELRISPTPAMTLIDVDGQLPADELAISGAAAAAKAIRRLDIGGSIGIDLPTSGQKSARQAAAGAIDDNLSQPFERTAVNGFGFVQIIRPRLRGSLIELASDRSAFEARALLRSAAFEPAGAKRIVAHPAIISLLESRPDWIEELARQTGGSVELRVDPALPMSGGYAQKH